MKKLFVITMFLFIAINVLAVIYISNSDGTWDNVTTWNATAPPYSTADNLTVSHSVTSNSSIVIKAGGVLHITGTGTLTVNADVTFNNGSTVTIDQGGKLVVNGNFTNKNNSTAITVNGGMDVSGNFDNGTGGIVGGSGTIDVNGNYTGGGSTFGNSPTSGIPPNTEVSGSSLPVELVKFNAYCHPEYISIQWTTASETMCDYFLIESSSDAITWHTIGTVKGSGNSNTVLEYEYKYFDQTNDFYFRLKQVDFDGKYEYYGPIYMEKEKKTSVQITFSENYIYVDFSNSGKDTADISLYNTRGELVTTQHLDNTKSTIAIDFLKKGVYIVRFRTDNLIYTEKFIRL